MKVLVVLCAVVASCLAKPYGYIGPVSSPIAYSSVVSVAGPYGYAPAYAPAAPALAYAAAPAPLVAAAPAVTYATAPAPLVAAAPAVTYAAAPAPAVVHAAPVPAVAAKSQYHAQNELGEASYGHSEPGQTHNAVQDAHGNKVGSFSYVNPEGQVLRTDYVADGAGYRVASNALPAAPIVTPIDTPEVAAAKAAFHTEYALRAAHLRRRRSLALVQTPASTAPLAAPLVYSAPAVAYSAPAVAPLAYSAPAVAPLAYSAPAVAPLAYSAPAVAPLAYSAPAVAPLAYSAPAVAPLAHAAPASRLATLTTVVNNPGHAVSYRVD